MNRVALKPRHCLHRTRSYLKKRYSVTVGALQESSEWELQGTNSVIAILTTSRKIDFKGICTSVARIQMKILNS